MRRYHRAAAYVGDDGKLVPERTRGERQAELGDVTVRRDLGRIHPEYRFPGYADLACRERAVPGLPMHSVGNLARTDADRVIVIISLAAFMQVKELIAANS